MLYNKVGWFDVSLQSESVITGSDNTSRNAFRHPCTNIFLFLIFLIVQYQTETHLASVFLGPNHSVFTITACAFNYIIICPSCTVCGQKSPQYETFRF